MERKIIQLENSAPSAAPNFDFDFKGIDYYSNATTRESSWNAPPGSTDGSAGLVMRNNPLQTERNEL